MSNNSTNIDEKALIAELTDPKKQRAAFSKVITLYQEQLYWQIRKLLINHDDTADVLQNTFLKAWSNIGSFRGNSKLSTWEIEFNFEDAKIEKKYLQKFQEILTPKQVFSWIQAENKFIGSFMQKGRGHRQEAQK